MIVMFVLYISMFSVDMSEGKPIIQSCCAGKVQKSRSYLYMVITSIEIVRIEQFWTFLTSTFPVDVKKVQKC